MHELKNHRVLLNQYASIRINTNLSDDDRWHQLRRALPCSRRRQPGRSGASSENQVQLEGTVILFRYQNLKPWCFQARVNLHRPRLDDEVAQEVHVQVAQLRVLGVPAHNLRDKTQGFQV